VYAQQQPQQQPPQGLAEYVLGPGDTVDVSVFGEPDESRTAIIRPDGKINLPLIGDVQASGLTPAQLAERVTVALKAYLKNPQVSVSVRTFQRAVVYLVGQVAHPGSVEIQQGWTLLDVMAATGGLTSRAAARRASVIRRGTGQTINVDLERLLIKGDRSANLPLEPGDIVMVPALQNRVLVLGSVHTPGAHDLDEGARFMDAIAAAGGPLPRSATKNIGVIRTGPNGKPVVTAIDMNKILKGDVSLNLVVQDADIIYVPEGPLVRWTDVLTVLTGLGLIRTIISP
jgi:polysaccharide export outer membrane protein